ncbi:hypothetical protein HHI36_005419 [Cryptolaemus montrouzieri]|uniref:Uncharacterized protein n=1 Tax=Cryptolaemus montrouzieri TaxID=559131 RepID=A0ABD2NUA6_9CUCU
MYKKQSRTLKALKFRLKKYLRKTSIALSFTDENIQQTQPPWVTKAPKVNLELEALGAKSNTKPSNYQLLHDRIQITVIFIQTDLKLLKVLDAP